MAHPTTSVFRVASAYLWWVVILIPLAVFAAPYWAEFGLRDDYAMLREASEEPGKILRFACAQGRPVYGLLLEGTFRLTQSVPALALWRTVGMLCIGATGVLLAWVLIRHRRWAHAEAGALASFFVLLPCAQVVAGWAVAWPHALAAFAGLAAYSLFESALTRHGWARGGWGAAAGMVFLLAVFTYQPNALTYLVPVAAGWLRPIGMETRRDRLRWLGLHVGFVTVGLTFAFLITVVGLNSGVVEAAARVALEPDPLSKLRWFAEEPLRQALALHLLRDAHDRTEPWFLVVNCAALAAIAFGLLSSTSWRWGRAATRGAGLVVLVLTAYSVNLIAAERWASYRTLWPLTGVVLVGVWNGLRRLRPAVDEFGHFVRFRRLATGAAVLTLAIVVHWQALTLISQPQQAEWRRFRAVAEGLDPVSPGRVFVISPQPTDTRVAIRHLDEFGSYSADADWAAKEMLIQAMRAAHPWTTTPFRRVEWNSGYTLPRAQEFYDHVVDLRPTR